MRYEAGKLSFEGVDPTLFNFASDILAVLIGFVFSAVVGYAFLDLLSMHIRKGRTIPVSLLGYLPENFFMSTYFAHMLRWSGPCIFLMVLLLIGDFSHSIADLGLSFDTVNAEGPMETVLSLVPEQRNPMRLFELSGDPITPRNSMLPQSAVDGDYSKARQEASLIDAFLVAVSNVAEGSSPFLGISNKTSSHDVEHFGTVGVAAKDIAKIDLELPLTCETSEMAQIAQSINGLLPTTFVGIQSAALVPNCTFSSPRSSGIHNSKASVAEILESFEPYGIPFDMLQAGSLVDKLTFSPSSKRLARDRSDWTQGRLVSDIEGIQLGDTMIIFNSTVLATGDDGFSYPKIQLENDEELVWVRQRYYILVSNVYGECPPTPTGRVINNPECIVFTTVLCDQAFQEDLESTILSDYVNPGVINYGDGLPESRDVTCTLENVAIHWGRNFDIDERALAVVSAVVSMARLQPLQKIREFYRVRDHAALAALFALGSTTEKPSNQSIVVPKIDLVYMFFLLLPLFVGLGLYLGTVRGPRLAVPMNAWELLVMGRESANVPTRPAGVSEFTKEETSKQYFLGVKNSGQPGIFRVGEDRDDYQGDKNSVEPVQDDREQALPLRSPAEPPPPNNRHQHQQQLHSVPDRLRSPAEPPPPNNRHQHQQQLRSVPDRPRSPAEPPPPNNRHQHRQQLRSVPERNVPTPDTRDLQAELEFLESQSHAMTSAELERRRGEILSCLG